MCMRTINDFTEAATRQFTDRQKPRALFEGSIKNLNQTKCISYYGIGGIGKTRLLAKLKQEAEIHAPNSLSINVDFEESYFRNIGEFLNLLKSQILMQEKVEFFSFDLAYAIYWARTQPGELLMEKSDGVIKEDHILFDVMGFLEDIPYANVIPKAVNLMSKIPNQTKKTNWWHTTGKVLATQINVIHDIQKLSDILVNLWVSDVTAHFQKTGKKIIFFFDSFESLDLNRLPRVQKLMYKFPTFPVLFIVGSRNKLNWESTDELIIDEHIVGELSAKDIGSFLQACQIKCLGEQCSCQNNVEGTPEENRRQCEAIHEQIIEKIIHVTNGIPIYLDLMVDTYMHIKKSNQPKPKHFTDNRNEIVPLLLKHFSNVDYAFLELLSFPNYWNYQIVKLLMKEYNPGISLSQIGRFYEYSFIQQHSKAHITMQSFIRQWLQQKLKDNPQSNEFYEDVHRTLFGYYDEQFKEEQTFELFKEAAYHAQLGLTSDVFEQWLQKSLETLLNKGYLDGITHYLQTLIDSEALSSQADAIFHVTLLNCYMQLGQYEQIIQQANTAINKANQVKRTDYRAKVQYIFGSSYYAMSEYEQAIKYFKLSSATSDFPLLAIDAHMKIGKISVTISDFEAARAHYLQASKQINALLKMNMNDTTLNSLAGQCYEKLGELMAYFNLYSEELRLFKQSIHYLKIAVADEAHSNYLQHVTLLGFSTKRLAEAYEREGGDVIGTYNEAIATYEKVLSVIPHSVDTLEKLGHACANLMCVSREQKQLTLFLQAFKKANEAFSTVIELAPKQGSSLNRLSSIHLEMALHYMDSFDYSQAKMYLDKASYYYELTITRATNYAYAPAKKKAIEEAYERYNKEIVS